MSQMGLTAQPSPGNDIQSFIDFLNGRKKKQPNTPNPVQQQGTAPNAAMYGGSVLTSPAMRSLLGR
jgi:hypothetical protein